ncbi:MAG: M13 family metallopeptidase [Ruminococcus sp.]|nr:M13 family metallopeptidase [Ruminococcus sp.]
MTTNRNTTGIVAAALALCISFCSCAEGGILTDTESTTQENEKAFSIADIRPGDDFYGWCNAAELMEMHIPENRNSSGTFPAVNELVEEQIKSLVKDIADSGGGYASGTNEQLIYDLYHLANDYYTKGKDTNAFDEKLANEVFDAIDDVESIDSLFTLWGWLDREYGVAPAIIPSVRRDLYDTSLNSLYINQTTGIGDLESAVEHENNATYLRNELSDHLSRSSIEEDDAKERATQITYMLLDIGSVTDFYDDEKEIKQEDFWFPYTQEKLTEKLKNISSEKLLQMLGLSGYKGSIVLANENQFFMIDSLLDEDHLQQWKDYTRCCFVAQYQMTLPPSCGGTSELMNTSKQQELADKYSLAILDNVLSREIGELYAEKYFTEEIRRDAEEMCEEIIGEYAVLISEAEWLSEDGKTALLSKLNNMECYVGAAEPHEVDSSDAARIGRSLLETQILDYRRQSHEKLQKLGEPAENDGYSMMPPQTVNACYDPQGNCFVITAAILNPPVYDPAADHAANLGSIGTVIGHEISHAFDNNGMNYDPNGCYRPEWMPEADRKSFAEIQAKAVDYYNGFTVLNSYKVKGRKTLSENLADISGVQCALAIAGTQDKQKLVFEHYADLWKELTLDSDAKDQISYDEHSPGPVRVNAVVACFDEFYEIYGVQEGDKLYVAPADRIKRW